MKILNEMPKDAPRYVKKLIPIQALQIDTPFMVKSLEGDMQGGAGDYLMKGIQGELYVCAQHIFEQSYELYRGIR